MIKSLIKANLKRKYLFIFLFLFAIGIYGLILAIPEFIRLVEFLGQRIPQKNMRLDYIKGLLWATLLGSTIFVWPIRAQDKKSLLIIWVIKCFVMFIFMLFYEYHYQLDSYGYFEGAGLRISGWQQIISVMFNFPVTFVAWLHQNSFFNSYHALKASFGMIGFLGVYIFYRSVVIFWRQEKTIILYLIAFFPSILFWSSIIGKDPIVLLYVSVYCYGAVKWISTPSFFDGIVMILGIIFISTMRPWWGIIAGIPVFFTTFIFNFKNGLKKKIPVLLMLLLVVLFYSIRVSKSFTGETNTGLPFLSWLLDVGNQKYVGFSEGSSAVNTGYSANAINNAFSLGGINNVQALPHTAESVIGEGSGGIMYQKPIDIIAYLPWGMFTVLFRPFPGEVNNFFGLLAGLEGAFVLILFCLAIMRVKRNKISDPVIIWAVLLVLLWSAIYALVGFNFGTICRYRLQILPVFLALLLYLADRNILSEGDNVK